MKLLTKKRMAIAAGVIVVGGAAAAWLVPKGEPKVPPSKYRSAQVDMGAINQTVTATGTINPVALVNVGSQVSGTVVELNADFNDRVRKGQVLLKLDPTIFNAQIRQAEASRASALANLKLAQANFHRNQQLVTQNFVSSVALDGSRREMDVARANVQLAEAQLARAQAEGRLSPGKMLPMLPTSIVGNGANGHRNGHRHEGNGHGPAAGGGHAHAK